MSAKSYFPLYVNDFIGGTLDFSAEELGAYIMLLCHQWARGGIADDTAVIERISRCARPRLDRVLQKFERGDDGLLRNRKMASVRCGGISEPSGGSGIAKKPRSVDGGAFDMIWAAYPRKVGKAAAVKAWRAIANPPAVEVVIKAIETWRGSDQWSRDGGKFIPHMSTWLRRDGWLDVVTIDLSRRVDYDAMDVMDRYNAFIAGEIDKLRALPDRDARLNALDAARERLSGVTPPQGRSGASFDIVYMAEKEGLL